MNPRVSRSSALASKATGFPIAKIAAKLAVGYTLDEIPNDITRKTPASFEPTIDYVVTKVPRWAFEKFPGSPGVLGTSMQSVGEAMAIGRTFPESLQKALRSLEHGRHGLNCDAGEAELDALDDEELLTPGRHRHAGPALPARGGAAPRRITVDALADRTRVDPWFLDQMLRIVEERDHLAATGLAGMGRRDWKRAKQLGFSDAQLAWLWGSDAAAVRAARLAAGVRPTFKTVDTCGAEFEASTPYHYSTYEDEDEVTAERAAQGAHPRARARTASGRASSSTTAACTPASPWPTPATRPSCSTATPRRSRPTTTPPTASTSSRSRWRTPST